MRPRVLPRAPQSGFLAGGFFAAGFFAAGFFAAVVVVDAFLATGFLAAGFFAAVVVFDLPSTDVADAGSEDDKFPDTVLTALAVSVLALPSMASTTSGRYLASTAAPPKTAMMVTPTQRVT